MISGDFLTRWNAITVGKGRGSRGGGGGGGVEDNLELLHVFGYVFLKEVL